METKNDVGGKTCIRIASALSTPHARQACKLAREDDRRALVCMRRAHKIHNKPKEGQRSLLRSVNKEVLREYSKREAPHNSSDEYLWGWGGEGQVLTRWINRQDTILRQRARDSGLDALLDTLDKAKGAREQSTRPRDSEYAPQIPFCRHNPASSAISWLQGRQ